MSSNASINAFIFTVLVAEYLRISMHSRYVKRFCITFTLLETKKVDIADKKQ